MSGFVSHLHVIKSKLLVIEEPVERGGFSPICYFMLGCEGIMFLLAVVSLPSWMWGSWGRGMSARGGHPECGLVTFMKPLVTSFCCAGTSVCSHKLHPGAGSQALQVYPKVFSCEMGEEMARKISLWIIFNLVSQGCVCPNVSLVPCSRGMRWMKWVVSG